ncbi:MAG: site-specific integrase [Beijerinckiaceae bacterium]|nr:site-specific integrase [Beijerinckiaceae bacterium]
MHSTLANVVLRGRVYHFRRPVPPKLKIRLNATALCCSLRTSDRRLAHRHARHLYLMSEDIFERLRADPMLSDAQIALMVQDFYDHILKLENGGRLRTGRLPEPVRQRKARRFADLADSFRADLGANHFERVSQSSSSVLAKHGLADDVSHQDHRRLQQALLRGWIEIASAIQARYNGDFSYTPEDALLAERVDEAFATPQAPSAAVSAASQEIAPSLDQTKSEPAAREPFTKLAAAFVLKQRRLKRWENQTAAQNQKSYELFCDICGDRSLDRYERRDAARFKDALERLPAEYGKAARYQGKAVAEIMRVDEAHGARAPRLSLRTVKRHMSALSAMWDEHIPLGLASSNIFTGFKFPKQKRAQDQRPMWSRADLQRLFATPIWSGCRSEHRRSAPGPHIIKDEKFWLPLIAIYSAARQEEICQLHVEDVRLEEGVHIFDINAKPPRRLKNRSAARVVPVHEMLIKIGFLEYVEAQRRRGETRVFPTLQPGGADGRLGHGYTKWFTRYRRDVSVYERGKDFHALRHSSSTFLHQGGAADSVIDQLSGHASPGETARYNKGAQVQQLRRAIDSIDPGLDLRSLIVKSQN